MMSGVHDGGMRPILSRIHDLLDANPEFAPRYEAAKLVVRAFRRPAFYEITQRCNLYCEGCYYFEDDRRQSVREQHSLAAWTEFFAAEAQRHVTMAYFVGAEPALHQERLVAASSHFPHGNIGTNGTIRIDPVVPYRIGVSLWAGDADTDKTLRGASVFRKAFKNYAGDPRAIMLYTVTSWNLGCLRTVAAMCRDHGLPLTFNLYSPTETFLNKLHRHADNDNHFFRVSRSGHTPCLSTAELARIRRCVAELMEEFPDTVIYSRAYNAWITEPGPRYDLDPQTGIATHCGSRINGGMKYFGSNLQRMMPKCCTPDVDCSQCRMYSGGWSSKFRPSARDVVSAAAFADWLDMIAVLGRIFLYERNTCGVSSIGLATQVAAE